MEFPELKNGVFTHFLLKGLKGEADTNRDGLVTVPEAYDYVSRRTRDATQGNQNPTFDGRVEGVFPLSIVSKPAPVFKTQQNGNDTGRGEGWD